MAKIDSYWTESKKEEKKREKETKQHEKQQKLRKEIQKKEGEKDRGEGKKRHTDKYSFNTHSQKPSTQTNHAEEETKRKKNCAAKEKPVRKRRTNRVKYPINQQQGTVQK